MEAADAPVVDLVIVNYRSYDELTRCLASIEPDRGALARAIVIDHESDRGAAAAVAARFPWVDLVERSTNEGFATGVNLGAARGSAAFLLLLNPDCVADGQAIRRLLAYSAGRPDAAVVGPRILNPDGTVQGTARRFPSWSTFLAGRSSWLTRRFPHNALSRWNLPAVTATTSPLQVDWVSGACMLIRREAFQDAAGMDEDFFLYWEDADLCRRLGRAGWRTVYFPGATVTHAGGRSSIHAYRESLAAFHASAFTLFLKHAGRWGRWLAPAVYLALQGRLRALLFIHRRRLTSNRLASSHRSSHS